jgi:hypothetical protein
MVEITPINAIGGPTVAPIPVPEMRHVADEEAARFETLVEVKAPNGAEQAEVQSGLLQPRVVDGATPTSLGARSIGDALVDGIVQVKNDYDSRFAKISATMAANEGQEISMQQALQIQYELMQVGLSQELTAKMADKTSSGVQTLFRNQG